MEGAELLTRLEEAGFRMATSSGKLKFQGPTGAMRPELDRLIRKHKESVLVLRSLRIVAMTIDTVGDFVVTARVSAALASIDERAVALAHTAKSLCQGHPSRQDLRSS